MSCPVARANSAWICGDWECATGLPMIAYRSLIVLLSPDLVALAEEPSSGDDQEVGVAPDARRKRGERRRHAHDLERRGVEHLEPRGAVELARSDVAVGPDGHREAQVAVDLAAGLGGIVDRADALHLEPPVLLVLREAVLRGIRADELLAGALLVLLDLAVDLRLQAHRREREVGEIAPARLGAGLLESRLLRCRRRHAQLGFARLREQLLLSCLERALLALRVG